MIHSLLEHRPLTLSCEAVKEEWFTVYWNTGRSHSPVRLWWRNDSQSTGTQAAHTLLWGCEGGMIHSLLEHRPLTLSCEAVKEEWFTVYWNTGRSHSPVRLWRRNDSQSTGTQAAHTLLWGCEGGMIHSLLEHRPLTLSCEAVKEEWFTVYWNTGRPHSPVRLWWGNDSQSTGTQAAHTLLWGCDGGMIHSLLEHRPLTLSCEAVMGEWFTVYWNRAANTLLWGCDGGMIHSLLEHRPLTLSCEAVMEEWFTVYWNTGR